MTIRCDAAHKNAGFKQYSCEHRSEQVQENNLSQKPRQMETSRLLEATTTTVRSVSLRRVEGARATPFPSALCREPSSTAVRRIGTPRKLP